MEMLIGVVGMLVLGGLYVSLGLADRGSSDCGSCLLRGDPEDGCLACPEARPPEPGRPWTGSAVTRLDAGADRPERERTQ